MRLQIEASQTFARGMNDSAAPSEYRPDEVAMLLNGRVSMDGNTIERRGGSKRSHSAALNSGAQAYGGIEYMTAAAQEQLVVFVGDKMYYSTDDGENWTNPSGATGLPTARWSLSIMRVGGDNLLLCAAGGNDIYSWNGATWTTLTNTPNGVKYLAVFNGRLWAGGHSGITVAASKVNDPNTWAVPDGVTVQAYTHDGDTEITGLFQLGGVLMVFKRGSVGYIEGFGYRTLTVETGSRGISRSVGCISSGSISPVGEQAIMWLSERGFELYRVGGQITLVSRPVQKFVDSLAWSNILANGGIPDSLWWPQKNVYWCAVPTVGTQNNYIFEYRPATVSGEDELLPPALQIHNTVVTGATFTGTMYVEDGYLHYQNDASRNQVEIVSGYLTVLSPSENGQWVELSSSYLALSGTLGTAPAVLLASDRGTVARAPYAVGYDGFVRLMEEGDKDDVLSNDTGGNDIGLHVVTRPMLFGQQFRRKRGRTVRVHAKAAAASTLDMNLVADGENKTTHEIALPASTGDMPTSHKSRINGKGYALQVDMRSTDDVTIAGVELYAEPLREAV